MISPDIKDLMRNMDSRYTLVVAAAKRARQLTAGAEPLTKFRSDKPVTLAIHEIAEGKVEYFRDAVRLPESKYGDISGLSRYHGPIGARDATGAAAYTTGIFDDEDGFADDMADSRAYEKNWRQDNRGNGLFDDAGGVIAGDENADLIDDGYGDASLDYNDDEDDDIGGGDDI